MAITKERLEELIKQEATIYWDDGMMPIELNKDCFVEDEQLYWFKKNFKDDDWIFDLDEIFETET